MLRANDSERSLSVNLEDVPAAFLIHCYGQGVNPTVLALEAYTHESPERFLGGPVRLIRGGTNRESRQCLLSS
jgi:hypothetical protein